MPTCWGPDSLVSSDSNAFVVTITGWAFYSTQFVRAIENDEGFEVAREVAELLDKARTLAKRKAVLTHLLASLTFLNLTNTLASHLDGPQVRGLRLGPSARKPPYIVLHKRIHGPDCL
jgi:hypothetical protein